MKTNEIINVKFEELTYLRQKVNKLRNPIFKKILEDPTESAMTSEDEGYLQAIGDVLDLFNTEHNELAEIMRTNEN